MDKENLIHEYLDGNLEDSRQSELFAVLADDPALRKEFNDYLSLRPALRNEAFSVATPDSLSKAVFAGLGYSFIEPEADISSKPRTGSRTAKILKNRILTHAATALVSTLMAVLVYIFITADKGTQAVKDKDTRPVTIAPKEQEAQNQQKIITRIVRVPVIISREIQADNVENEQSVITEYVPDKRDVTYSSLPGKPVKLNSNNFISAQKYKLEGYSNMLIETGENSISLSAGGMQNLVSQSDGIEPQSYYMINSFFSAGYRLTDKDIISTEFGRETFGQEYNRRINNIDYIVSQKPSLWWAAVGYEHIFDALGIARGINPSGRLALGATEAGPLAKLSANLNWTPEERVALWLGLEGSFMLYQTGGTYYLSRQLGIIYGINLKF